MTEHRKGIIAIVTAALLWSTGGLFIKLISLDAYQLSFYRSLFSALTFILLFRKKVFVFNIPVLINGLFYAGILILFVVATKLTTAANAIFLQYTAPIYVLIFEPLILKTKLKPINVIAVFISFIGMILFFVGEISPTHMEGNLVALLSGVCFAAFLIGIRKSSEEFRVPSIFWGNIFIPVLCFFSVYPEFQIDLKNFLMVAYLGIFQIGLAYAVFTYSIKRIEGIEAALIAMIEPVMNPIWVYIGYGEKPSPYAILGGLIILSTITIRTIITEKRRINLNNSNNQ
ncbi:MAG: EamA family transporter [Ignavibacteria bacterium]|jgi:drug/metabolite transporter (DMT)-like permease|nr:EamA family transporter [Ignavibacteria bacterium]MDH7528502.1 EamA family transporter [Ignavibacteria bacterium]